MTDLAGNPICELCGQPLPPSKGKGRPRTFHDKCRKLHHLVGWMEDMIQDADFTPDRAKILRSHLWQIGNSVKAKGQSGAK